VLGATGVLAPLTYVGLLEELAKEACMPKPYQVVIVGGGPVGVALAVELGQRNVSCVVVERHLEVGRIPKGQNLTQRTLEHFYFWHCVDELRAARLLPPGYPIGGLTAYGNLASEYWYAPPGLEQIRSYYFQENERGERRARARPELWVISQSSLDGLDEFVCLGRS